MARRDGHAMAPHAKLRPTDVGEVRWTEGFWADRFGLCRDTIIPEMWEAMHDPDNAAVFSNFWFAAGLQEGDHLGVDWSDGDCYKWMEAVAHVYGITQEPELAERLDEIIEVVGQAQDADGYINTQIQLTDKGRWEATVHHELYNMGHLLTSACVHHETTGKDNFLKIAVKLADYLYGIFMPRPAELANFPWNPSNIMGLVDLYRATGDRRYLELADVFVTMRGSQPHHPGWAAGRRGQDGTDQNQDHVPLREEKHAVGHAVTAMYLYCGATDAVAETGEPELREALERIWQDATKLRMYITGGVGTHHQGVSARGHPVHEAFGYDYQLPNATAYTETCANIGNAMWNKRLLELSGEAKYADVMERVIYNSLLSPVSADGKHFCYTNPLRWHGERHQMLSQNAQERWRIATCYCCPPQVARSIARLHNWAYSTSEEGVWVHIYGGSVLETRLPDGSRVKVEQASAYPRDGKAEIRVVEAPGKSFGLMLRIPDWAAGTTVAVNGEAVESVKAGDYLRLRREWAAGDRVALDIPLRARLVAAHPRVEEARNQVAVMWGPVVYCLESMDLPEGVKIEDVHLPEDAALAPRYESDLLGGVMVLEGEACLIREPEWDGKLYQDYAPLSRERVPIRLIPYYAWNNRGVGEMTVWLPLC